MEMIIRVLVEDILSFAFCDEEQMSEDFSVAQLERIAQHLRLLPQIELDEFIAVVQAMSVEAHAGGDTMRGEQLDLVPSHLGIM